MAIDNLLKTLVLALVDNKDDVVVKEFEEDAEGYIVYEVIVHKDDIGRVIGRNGSVAQAIRKLCYAAAMKSKKRVRINFDNF